MCICINYLIFHHFNWQIVQQQRRVMNYLCKYFSNSTVFCWLLLNPFIFSYCFCVLFLLENCNADEMNKNVQFMVWKYELFHMKTKHIYSVCLLLNIFLNGYDFGFFYVEQELSQYNVLLYICPVIYLFYATTVQQVFFLL